MRFKSITCLTKVSTNQTQTEKNENSIFFNLSKFSIEDTLLKLDIKEREVCYLASCAVLKEKEFRAIRPTYKVDVNWVKCFEYGEHILPIPDDSTDILIITRDIFTELQTLGLTPSDIYIKFREKGLGQMSVDLGTVIDFSALTAQLIE